MFEWGLNYTIAAQANHYIVVHAAAIERNGKVAILPGVPGAGKSTLTAALVQNGWRLLSDELALIRPQDRHVMPLARPINLKNGSIALMRAYAPEAIFSDEIDDTAKGTVALMRAPDESMARNLETAPIGWTPSLAPWSKAAGLMEIAHNAMNYSLHGGQGSPCWRKFSHRAAAIASPMADSTTRSPPSPPHLSKAAPGKSPA